MEEEEYLPDKRTDEELIIKTGKHWYLLMSPLFKAFLGLIIVFIILRIAGASIYFTIAFFLWAALGLTYFIVSYIVWSKSKYYLTDQRVISVEQKSLFAKKITEIEISNIHNVSYKISGAVSAAFSFGDVILQSYGAPKPLILKKVCQPQKIHKKISQMMSEYNTKNKKEPEETIDELEEKRAKHLQKYIPRAPKIEE